MAIKKQWYEIIAPKMFGEKVVGETLAVEPKQLIGRKIETNLVELSNDFSKFYVKLHFQISSVDGNKAYTKLVGHNVMRERIYRMVQRRVRRVDVIQDVVTKDNVNIRIKTVYVLIKRVNSSIKTATRKTARAYIDKVAKETDSEDLMNMIIAGDLQREVRKEINKIYPAANLEIRKTEIMSTMPDVEKKKTRKKKEEAQTETVENKDETKEEKTKESEEKKTTKPKKEEINEVE